MLNEDKVLRTWLVYSISKKFIFFICCKLFTNSKTTVVTKGYYFIKNDWKHIINDLKEHDI